MFLDISYDIYLNRYEEAGEGRELFSEARFRKIRQNLQWPAETERFERTIFVRIGAADEFPNWEKPPIQLHAKDDTEYRSVVFPRLMEAVCAGWV